MSHSSADRPSRRILDCVQALPLEPGMRVLEIGCGPGAAARLVAARVDAGYVLGIDRSATAVEQARAGSAGRPFASKIDFRKVAAEEFVLSSGEPAFDLAFALRVGALDGRHPDAGVRALARLVDALTPYARLFVDGGDPLREVALSR